MVMGGDGWADVVMGWWGYNSLDEGFSSELISKYQTNKLFDIRTQEIAP